MEAARVDEILDRYGRDPASVLEVLEDVQGAERYLPREALERVSLRLGVPLTRVYALATYYNMFSLEPRGEHICTVCMGTSCHVRGAARIVETIERNYSVEAGRTTADRKLTLETVNCIGACALAPVVIVDGKVHRDMSSSAAQRALRKLLGPGRAPAAKEGGEGEEAARPPAEAKKPPAKPGARPAPKTDPKKKAAARSRVRKKEKARAAKKAPGRKKAPPRKGTAKKYAGKGRAAKKPRSRR